MRFHFQRWNQWEKYIKGNITQEKSFMAFTELHFSIRPKDWRIFKSAIFPSLLCWRQLRAGGSKGFDLFKDWNPPLQLCTSIIQLMHAGMCHQLCIVPLLIHSFAGSCIGCCSEEILSGQRQKCIMSPTLIPFQWTHIIGAQHLYGNPSLMLAPPLLILIPCE